MVQPFGAKRQDCRESRPRSRQLVAMTKEIAGFSFGHERSNTVHIAGAPDLAEDALIWTPLGTRLRWKRQLCSVPVTCQPPATFRQG